MIALVPSQQERSPSGPTIPSPRSDEHFTERHATFLRIIREQPIDVLLLGDSITRRWAESPGEWERWFGDLNAANFGVGADLVQNLLWRIQNGELDGIKPRLIALLIGTNNLPVDDPANIADGIACVVEEIRSRVPRAVVLVLGIFPRGPQKRERASTDEPFYQDAVDAVNRRIATLDDGKLIHYFDIGDAFLTDDGEINSELMPDRLHPATAGFHVFGTRIRPCIERLLACCTYGD